MAKYKMYEVEVAYCSSYHIDYFEIKARSEKEALKKAQNKELSHYYEAELWTDVREMREDEYERERGEE